jgi:bifunctional DNA primase/polymerase-like protein/uncharacterized protein DUF3987
VLHNLAVALRHADAGFAVFPCQTNKKPQQGIVWNEVSSTKPDTIKAWWRGFPDSIVGIDLRKSDLIVIDCDRHDKEKDGVEAFKKLAIDNNEVLENHPITKTLSGGEHHYFKQQPNEKLGNGQGSLPGGINVRGAGGYVIAPGSRTDAGSWEPDEYAPGLEESLRSNMIPVLPEWLFAILKQPKVSASLPVPASPNRPPMLSASSGVRELAFADAALEGMRAEFAGLGQGNRNNALNGIAFRLGRLVARGWLSASDVESMLMNACASNGLLQEDGQKQCRDTIRSGLEAGKLEPHKDLADDPAYTTTAIIDLDGDRIESVKEKIDVDLLEPLTYCDGLVGEIIDWITDSARRPNRVLALGTAIAVVGTLIGRRVASPSRSATHLYVIGIAKTGAGKNHPIDCIMRLMTAANARHHIGPGEFISMPAVISVLQRKPLSICPIDEFGAFLKRINGRRASSFEASISKTLRQIWGASFQEIPGPEWAGRQSETISAPAISIVGATTRDEFFDSLQGMDVVNGFLNRFLVLQSDVNAEEVNPRQSVDVIPDKIIRDMNELYNWGGDLTTSRLNDSSLRPDPDILEWGEGAEAIYFDFVKMVRAQQDKDKDLEPFLSRCSEIAIRLATIRCVGRWLQRAPIDKSDMEWGAALAWQASKRLADEAKHTMVAELSFGQVHNRILSVVRERGGRAPRQAVCRALAKNVRSVKDIDSSIGLLVEGGSLRTEVIPPKNGSGKPAIWYMTV